MKEMFSVFYEKEKVNFNNLDESIVIVLDANVLLNFFRYSEVSKKKLLDALRKVRGNLFVPYQAALEYHFSRQVVNSSNKTNKETLSKELKSAKELFQKKVAESIAKYGTSIRSLDEEEIQKEVVKEFTNKLDHFWADFGTNDLVKETSLIEDNSDTLNKIAKVLEGKVGNRLTNIDEIEKEGSERFKNLIPPGYEDDVPEKDEVRVFGDYKYNKKYGDLIIWKEIINFCNDNANIKHVILLTDDAKDDWIYKVSKREKIGIRVELKQELIEKTGAKIDIIKTATFLSNVTNQKNIIKKSELTDLEKELRYNKKYYEEKKEITKDNNYYKILENNIRKNTENSISDMFSVTNYKLLSGARSEADFDDLITTFEYEYQLYGNKVNNWLNVFSKKSLEYFELKDEYSRIDRLYVKYKKSGTNSEKLSFIEDIIFKVESSSVYRRLSAY